MHFYSNISLEGNEKVHTLESAYELKMTHRMYVFRIILFLWLFKAVKFIFDETEKATKVTEISKLVKQK